MSESSWIKTVDLKETVLCFVIRNTTTNSPILNTADVELTEMTDYGMTLKMPKRSCAFGHLLKITIVKKQKQLLPNGKLGFSGEEKEMTVTAKVIAEQLLDFNSKVITLKFYQFDEKVWKRLIKFFVEKQKRIGSIVERMMD
jgi:hypothetical protein